MDVSWDIHALSSRINELPSELVLILKSGNDTQYLKAVTRTLQDRRYTDIITTCCEPILAHSCAELQQSSRQLEALAAVARVVPFAPYLTDYAHLLLAAHKEPLVTDQSSVDDTAEYLLALDRLLQHDHPLFSPHIPVSHVESFLLHDRGHVRLLAIRVLCKYLRAADAAFQEMCSAWLPQDDATGFWEAETIHYKYLTLWEEQRSREIKRQIRASSLSRKEHKQLGPSKVLDAGLFSPSTACINGILLPRQGIAETQLSSGPQLVQTPTTLRNMRALAARLKHNQPLLLFGLPGAGKSSLIRHAAARLNKLDSMITLHLNEQSDAKVLIGMYTTGSTPGTFVWKAGVLTKAVLEGRWVLIEDIDRAPTEIVSTLLPLIQRRELLIPSRGETIHAARGFRVIATMRSHNNARGQEVQPTVNMLGARLWQTVHTRNHPAEELSQIIAELHPSLKEFTLTLVTVFQEVQQLRRSSSLESRSKTGVMRALSQRDLFKLSARVARLMNGRPTKTAQDDDQIFLDAVDCFAGSLPASDALDALTDCIAQNLQIDPARRVWLLEKRNVEYVLDRKQLRVGQTTFHRQSQKSLTRSSRRIFSTNPHTLRMLERVSVAVAGKEPLLLVGETGTGKTTTVQHLADQLERKLVAFNLSQQSESGDLLGGFKPINTRSLMTPLKDEFDDLFIRSFSSKVVTKNQPFLDLLGKTMARGQWLKACKLWKTALGLVEELRSMANKSPSASPARKPENPNKKRRIESALTEAIDARWSKFASAITSIESRLMSGSASAFAFSFVEGNIVKAVRNGDWVLLDEINLASPDTLEALADLLDPSPSLMLSESGSIERIEAHPDFRLFAAMNPATDVGKKDLTLNIRSRFTELYVESPDKDLQSLQSIAKAYLGEQENVTALDVSRLYQAIQDQAAHDLLIDGAGQRPHFSLRTLTRALTYAKDVLPQTNLRRALYEGFQMSFLTLLDKESESRVLPTMQKHLYKDEKKAAAALTQPPRKPENDKAHQYIRDGAYWLKQGDFPIIEQPLYIITNFIRRNLDNLMRASSTRRFPVLIQGPTSSGKTSMIEYLANRSGNKFVRINNHEHTDLQEYLGTYVSGADGKLEFQDGILVKALREGHWIVLDELNLAPTDVLEALNRLLDDNRELLIPETQEIVRPHENFMLFATQNPAGLYGGRKVLSRAFRNRFLELHFDDIPVDELHVILHRRTMIPDSWCQRIVSVYKELSIVRQQNRVFEQKSFATLRDLFRWALRPADTIQQLAINGFMLLAERVRNHDERLAVKNTIEKVLSQRGPKVVIDENVIYGEGSAELQHHMSAPSQSRGVVWTSAMRRLYVLTLHAIQNNEPVLLVGETGCGKTTVCQMLAEVLGKDLHIVNAHQNTETGDLIGAQRPARNKAAVEEQLRLELSTTTTTELREALNDPNIDHVLSVYDRLREAAVGGTLEGFSEDAHSSIRAARIRLKALFEWADGSLVHAMKTGQFFLLDEISLADDSVLERLNSVLESQRTLLLAEKGSLDSFITAEAGFQFFATMNPGGDYGKKELSPALRNRFTEVWVPALSDTEDVLQIVRAKLHAPQYAEAMVGFAQWFNARYNTTASSSISIRDTLSWVDFINSFQYDAMLGVVHGAAMVYVDTLGANPAALLAVNPADVAAERIVCLTELGRLINQNAVGIYSIPVGYVLNPSELTLGPFSIPRQRSDHEDQTFTLAAPTTRSNTMRVVRAMHLSKPILLEGNPGVGKTSLVTALSQLVGVPLTRINLSEQTDLMDLFGSDTPVEGAEAGTFAWQDAPFLRAMKMGEWVLLDEMNLASQSVLEGLNACLDHRGEVYISELDQTFRRHPDFKLFAAQNPHHQGGGRKGLPASFVNRFTVVYADLFLHDDLVIICTNAFPNQDAAELERVVMFINQLDTATSRRQIGIAGGPWEFNLRDSLRWLALSTSDDRLLSAGSIFDFLDMIITQRFRTANDRELVLSLYRSVFKDTPQALSLYHNLTSKHLQVGIGLLDRHSTTSGTQDVHNLDFRPHLSTLQSMMVSIQQGWPLILAGPSGCGKTALLEQLANVVGVSLVTFPLNADIDSTDLVGGFEQADPQRATLAFFKTLRSFAEQTYINCLASGPGSAARDDLAHNLQKLVTLTDRAMHEKSILRSEMGTELLSVLQGLISNGMDVDSIAQEFEKLVSGPESIDRAQFEWLDGTLVQAMQRGQWIVLDNANLCSPAVLDRLNSLLEPNGCLIINEHTDSQGRARVIKPHPDFRIFLTMDPKYGELSRALRNRAVELFILPSENLESNDDTGSALTLCPESSIYRLRNVQSLSHARVEASVQELIAEQVVDHLSFNDFKTSSSSLGESLKAGLGVLPRNALQQSLQTLEPVIHIAKSILSVNESVMEVEMVINGAQHLTSAIDGLKTVHPLNNETMLRCQTVLAGNDATTWPGRVFDLAKEVSRMRNALSDIEAASGPVRSLTRLQRSAQRNTIPNIAKESTATIYPFLLDLLDVIHSWSHTAMSGSEDIVDLPTLTALKSMQRFWWGLFAVTSSSRFEEAAFQAHLEIGRSWIRAVQGQIDSSSRVSKELLNVTRHLKTRHELANGGAIVALWSALKPKASTTFSHLQNKLQLELLADKCDTQLWDFQVSLGEIVTLRSSFAKQIRVFQDEMQSEAEGLVILHDLNTLVPIQEDDSATDMERPHFQGHFEFLCQLYDLYNARWSSLNASHAIDKIRDPLLSLLALRPTKSLITRTTDGSLSPAPRIMKALEGYIGSLNKHSTTLALSEDVTMSTTRRLREADTVPLNRLRLLEHEVDALSKVVACDADLLKLNQVRSLDDALRQLLLSVSRVLQTSEDSEWRQWGSEFISQLEGAPQMLETSRLPHVSFDLFASCASYIAQPSTPLSDSACAWIRFALGCISLYVPNQPFDPALKPLIQRDLFRRNRDELNTNLAALKAFESYFTGQLSSLRIRLVEEDLQALGDEPPVPRIARPPESQIVQLQGELQALSRTLSPLLQQSASTQLVGVIDSVLLQNVAQLKRRLTDGYRAYEDITGPLIGFLSCLQIGFTLATLSQSQANEVVEPTAQLQRLTPLLGATPSVLVDGKALFDAMSQPINVQLHALSSFGVARSISSSPVIAQASWESAHNIFDMFYERWRHELKSGQSEAAASTSLYRYKGDQDAEDEVDDEEYKALFPEYESLPGESEEKATDSTALQSLAPRIADIHHSTLWARKDSSNPVMLLLDQAAAAMNELRSSTLHATRGTQLMPLLILQLDKKSQLLHGMRKTDHSYSIYTDPNIAEAQKLVALVHKVQVRFRSIQKLWPEHATLGEVLRTCDELLAFKHVDPVAKLMTKLEKLHGFVNEWQKVASSELKVLVLYDSITDLIVSWRQLELTTWSRLLDMETTKCAEDAKSWWFIAYENIIRVPLSIGESDGEMKLHIVELLKTLESFFLSTGYGQFSQRLRMLAVFREYVKIRSASAPPLRFVGDALDNFISYMAEFEASVSEAIMKGRQALEKDMKNIIQMASWKDRTIDALKESAKASHRKLFRVIRKFRAVLGRPAEGIIRAGVPDAAASPHSVQALVKIRDVDTAATELQQYLPDWTEAPARFKNVGATISVMHSMGQAPPETVDGAAELNVWLTDTESLIAQLGKLTPKILTDDNKAMIKHLKTRKRTLFADTLKELRIMGFKTGLSSDALAKQETLEAVLGSLSTLEQASSGGVKTANHCLHQLLHVMPSVREAGREHSNDITSAEVSRSVSLLESMLQMIILQRSTLHSVQSGKQSLEETFAKVDGLVQASTVLPAGRQPSGFALYDAVCWLPAVIGASAEVVEAQLRIGTFDTGTVVQDLKQYATSAEILQRRWQSCPQLPSGLTTADEDQLRSDAQALISSVRDALSAIIRDRAYLEPVLAQALVWTAVNVQADQVLTNGHAAQSTISEYSVRMCDFVDQILGSLESVQKPLSDLPVSTENPAWLIQQSNVLTSAVKALRTQHVASRLNALLEEIAHLDPAENSLHIAVALLRQFNPIIRQYEAVVTFLTGQLAAVHQSMCFTSYRLAKIFSRLAREGFCTPPEKESGNQQGQDKLEGGTGLGEGDGGEDISKDIQDDEDLSELAQEPDQKGDKEELEDEKDAVDMADQEMEGEMGDVEEKGEDEEGDEGEDQDMDEEAGDVDDLGPNTIDEKMWDDGGKKDEDNKEQEAEDGKGTVDKEEMAGAEGEKKEGNEEKKEGGDEEPEEEVGAEEREEGGGEDVEKADPHMQEQDNLDLPDDIDMDGQESDDGLGSDMEEMGDADMADEEKEGIEEHEQDQTAGDPGSPTISETGPEDDQPDTPTQQAETGDDDLEDKTQDVGEDAEEEAADDESVLQDQRPDESNAAEDIAPSEAQGTGLSEQLMQDKQNQQDAGAAEQEQGAEGSASDQQQAAGAQGQRGKAQDEKKTSGQDQDEEESEESLPYKKLGDALEKWYKQHQQVADAQDRDEEPKPPQDTDMADAEFEHLPDEGAEADTQALGAATEEQATAIDEDAGVAANDKETQDYFPPDKEEEEREAAAAVDVEMQNVDNDVDARERNDGKEQQPNAFIGESRNHPYDQDPSEQDQAEDEADVEEVDTQLQTTHIDHDHDSSSASLTLQEARSVWSLHESRTRTLALTLTEHLRLILAPTQATKMRGDFRTGKRLNIKRIIPYIASQYKRDKIWLRRSVPSKRSYQILLALDDSKSMAESRSTSLALDTLALVARSLAMLEAGELAVVGFGADVRVAHDFAVPWSADAGADVVRGFGFAQTQTDVQVLLRRSLALFGEARARAQGRAAELWQLMLVVSDGVCKDHEGIRRLVRRAREERVMIVFVVVDAAAASTAAVSTTAGLSSSSSSSPAAPGGPSNSILDLKTAVFGKDANGNPTVETMRYLETFPFQYYLVVRDVGELPGVLASALRQWFAEVVETG